MADRLVPQSSSSTAPISGLPELQAHLQSLVNDPSLPIDAKLTDDVELQLTESNIPPLLPTLLPPLTTILHSTPHDPTPLLSLTTKLLSPLTFPVLLEIAPPPVLLTALQSPLPGANLLALSIIHKAAATSASAATLADLVQLVGEVVRVWLQSPDTGVGERAGRVLGDVLETDCDVEEEGGNLANGVNGTSTEIVHRRSTPGLGKLWKLILGGETDLLGLIVTSCDISRRDHPDPRQGTVSQGRLLGILPRLCTLNIFTLNDPHPQAFSGRDTSILEWAALHMVDREDILMDLTLVSFFEALVSVMRVAKRGDARQRDGIVGKLVKAAVERDGKVMDALRALPDRTVEDESEALRAYIAEVLRG